ncbi:MAG: hypothetical protein JNL97_05030 [Verrucomicrobiales bacterium]|nr:hypothetical protein [Verrucomicrobiales bacterium]
MKRANASKADWRRFLKPPPPTPRDVRIFTWCTPVLGVVFFALVLAGFRWNERERSGGRDPWTAPVEAFRAER